MSEHNEAFPPATRLGVSSAESRSVKSHRASIYYEVYGTGRALLLIPGAFDNLIHWSFNIPRFVRAGYRVIAMNLRGHFMSPCHDADTHFRHHAADIAAVLRAEDVQEVAIAASSFGGFGAIRYAIEFNSNVKALVLSGSTAGVDSDENFRNNYDAVQQFDAYFISGAKAEASFDATERPNPFLYRQIGQLGSTDGSLSCAFQAVKSMQDRAHWLTAAQLANYQTPTLLVGGNRDTLLGPGFQREVARLIPGARLSEWADSGHIPFWENPDRYNQVVIRFLLDCGYGPQQS